MGTGAQTQRGGEAVVGGAGLVSLLFQLSQRNQKQGHGLKGRGAVLEVFEETTLPGLLWGFPERTQHST